MGTIIRLPWGVSRVLSSTLDLLEDDERRCLDLSILQVSVLRQMVYPWVQMWTRLVEDHGDYQETIDMPTAYLEALEGLEILLSGAYDGPKGGCPVGEVFVDRGDLPGFDMETGNFTKDGTWREWDLTNVIGAPSATRVMIRCSFTGSVAGGYIYFRQEDNVAGVNIAGQRVQVAGEYIDLEVYVELPGTQKVSYNISSTITVIYCVVRGYWMPAAW